MRMLLISILIIFSLSSCYTTLATLKKNYDFDENIRFTIDKVQEGNRISTGSGGYSVSRGNKFVFIYMTFENKTSIKQDLNFNNIFLFDMENKVKYKVEFSMVAGPVNIWGKVDSYINSVSIKSRKIVFVFPKEIKPEFLLVNNKIVPIEYTD